MLHLLHFSQYFLQDYYKLLLMVIYIYIYIYMMKSKCSPVRYTIPTLEQPVPENKKVQRKAF